MALALALVPEQLVPVPGALSLCSESQCWCIRKGGSSCTSQGCLGTGQWQRAGRGWALGDSRTPLPHTAQRGQQEVHPCAIAQPIPPCGRECETRGCCVRVCLCRCEWVHACARMFTCSLNVREC